ncbi:hypothetical protein MMG36_002392 [Salmonella enterica subsp. enterica serovar Newport]|nr:hypothetical protein [Salmonella enterica subsp. enterica serovar Newport]
MTINKQTLRKAIENELRTKFEEWVESDGPLPCGGIKKQRTSNGGYSLQAYNYAWEAWKASAAETTTALMNATPVAWTDAEELRDLAKDGCGAMLSVENCQGVDPRRQILLFTNPAPLRDAERQELEQYRRAGNEPFCTITITGDGPDVWRYSVKLSRKPDGVYPLYTAPQPAQVVEVVLDTPSQPKPPARSI